MIIERTQVRSNPEDLPGLRTLKQRFSNLLQGQWLISHSLPLGFVFHTRMNKAFSLPELLFTLALLAVLSSFAVPSLDRLLTEQRSASIINQLIMRIEVARKQALLRGQTLTLCPGQGSCLGRDDWIKGALLFVDREADGKMDASDELVRTFPPLDASGRIQWRSFGNRPWIQFRPNGLTPYQSGRLTYCPSDGNPRFARQVILNTAGRTRLASDQDGDDIVETSKGQPLSC